MITAGGHLPIRHSVILTEKHDLIKRTLTWSAVFVSDLILWLQTDHNILNGSVSVFMSPGQAAAGLWVLHVVKQMMDFVSLYTVDRGRQILSLFLQSVLRVHQLLMSGRYCTSLTEFEIE